MLRAGARVSVVCITLLVVAVASLSLADSPLAAGGVRFCVPKKEGSPILTAKHGKCGHGYHLANLQGEGKEGKPGPTGEAGQQGETGPEGKTGAEGFTSAEAETLKSILPYVKYVASGVGGKPTIQFSGVNVQVVSGADKTSAAVNGEGNLVVGYDENPGKHEQTGSHNLILGEEQAFTSFGAIVAGSGNTVAAPFASIVGGHSNIAHANFASVSGGESNEALGASSAVNGGAHNHAIAIGSSVSGGSENESTGAGSSVSGGKSNVAEGTNSSIFGAKTLRAKGEFEALPACVAPLKAGVLC
jgi:hypothetical protein